MSTPASLAVGDYPILTDTLEQMYTSETTIESLHRFYQKQRQETKDQIQPHLKPSQDKEDTEAVAEAVSTFQLDD